MITKKVEILNYIEENKFITIDICKNLFYNTRYGYDSARRTLSKLVDERLVKVSVDFTTNKKVFFIKKKPSSHRIMIYYIYSKIATLVDKVLEFNIEYKSEGVISDGFIIYKKDGIIKALLIEIDLQNRTKLNKYDKCYSSAYFQRKLNCFPRILIANRDGKAYKTKVKYNKNINYIYCDYECSNLEGLL